jgi:hypothetical protein
VRVVVLATFLLCGLSSVLFVVAHLCYYENLSTRATEFTVLQLLALLADQ